MTKDWRDQAWKDLQQRSKAYQEQQLAGTKLEKPELLLAKMQLRTMGEILYELQRLNAKVDLIKDIASEVRRNKSRDLS